MALNTTFWLPSSGTPDVSPAFDNWGTTSQGDRVRMVPRNFATSTAALTDVQIIITNGVSGGYLARQYVSDPIMSDGFGTGGLYNGGFSGVCRFSEDNVAVNAGLAMSLRVFSRDGLTKRSDLIGPGIAGAYTGEFTLDGAASTYTWSVSTYSVNILRGDRLVFEIGAWATSPGITGFATFRFGTSAATDFALTSGLTTDLNPFIRLTPDVLVKPAMNNYLGISAGSGISVSGGIR